MSFSSVPDPPATTSVRLVVVDPLGCVEALLEIRPPRPAGSPYSHAFTCASLESVLRRPAWRLPHDTPIARLDGIPYHQGMDFQLLGPMPAAYLPAGTVRPATGPRRPYRGERWDTLGMLTQVSIDIYLTLVCQVGGVVTRAADARAATAVPAGTAPVTEDVTGHG